MNIAINATIGGKSHGLQFHSVQIIQEIFRPTEMRLELGFNAHEADPVFDKARSSWLGETLAVVISDRQDPSISKTYEGIIAGLTATPLSIILRAVSEDYGMTLTPRYRSFTDKTLGEIAHAVIDEAVGSSDVSVPGSSLKFQFYQQYNETDAEFLAQICRADGCVFYHDGDTFVFADKLSGRKSVALKLEDLRQVSLECSLDRTKWKGAPYNFVKHLEPADCVQESAKFTPASHPFAKAAYDKSETAFDQVEEAYHTPVIEKKDFQQSIKNWQAANAGMMTIVAGETGHPMVSVGNAISCAEHPLLKDTVTVVGLHASFSGNVYTGSFHAVVKDAIVPPRDGGRRGLTANTLQPAVVKDNVDKENLGRVQVQYLWDTDGSACAWARLAHTGAGMGSDGTQYGTHYIPRLKDHVLVACENGDPSLPIVVGALYHSEHKPDFSTKNGTEEVLVCRTPQQTEIRVLDKSGTEEIHIAMKDNKNIIKLELKQPQITVESVNGTIIVHSKLIKINADEKIEMTAKEIQITASDNMKVDVGKNSTTTIGKDAKLDVGGNRTTSVSQNDKTSVGANSDENVTANKTIQAQANLALKAGAQGELSATAQLKISSAMVESSASAMNVIKGALVQIN